MQGWAKTTNGYIHIKGYQLLYREDVGVMALGGVWYLYKGAFKIGEYPTTKLCKTRLFRWAAATIKSFEHEFGQHDGKN